MEKPAHARSGRRPIRTLSTLVIWLIINALTGSAQTNHKSDRATAEYLTRSLMVLNAQYQAAPPTGRAALLPELHSLAAQRQRLLSSLLQTNPGEVLRVAMPGRIAATFPASVQESMEQETDTQGELQVMYEDSHSGAKLRHFLKTAGQRLELKFAANAPTNLLTGTTVHVHGTRIGSALALNSGNNTGSFQVVQTPPLSNSFGAQSTLVMLVNFQDNSTQPYTAASAQDVVFNQTSAWDMENSLQQTWLTGDVVGWYTLPMTSSTCDTNTLADNANAAATAAGVNLANYAHYVYAFPSISTCGWWGLGTVGGSPSQAWINGTPFSLKVVGHEMGHNFGLYHSHSWSCGNVTLGSNCVSSEYGDELDIMGNPTSGHFNGFQKERLGWLNYGASPSLTLVQSTGTYSIGPFENQDMTSKGLKILQSKNPANGANTYYYVELRQAIGQDSFLSNDSNVLNGLVVHTGTDNDPNSSELLNMAPSLNNFYFPALDTGLSFVDPTAGVTIQTLSAGPTGASVGITLGTPTCAEANPTVTISPAQGSWVMPGTPVTFTVSLANNDNAGCAASTFNLSSSLPAGWNAAVFGSSSLMVSPGATTTTTMQVTSPSGTPDGFYNFTATATNGSASTYTGSSSATYVISTVVCTHANPTVSMSPTQSLGMLPGTSVLYVVSVFNNDSSGCTASTFNLSATVPSGWPDVMGTPSLTLGPGATGSTSLQVSSPSNAAPGTYYVTPSAANASAAGYSGSATAMYVVSSPLSMTVATDASSYKWNQTVNMTATVMSGATPLSGATVTFLIIQPDTTMYQYFATTGSSGIAMQKFRLGKKSPTGTYTVQATTNTTQGTAQANTTFSVH